MLSFIKNMFGKKIPNIDVPVIGSLMYDNKEGAWELIQYPKDLINGLDLNYCCITGFEAGPSNKNIVAFTHYIQNPNLLWEFIDSGFLEKASEDFPEISASNFKDNFYIYSLTLTSPKEFELGFHSRNKDIFIELFVVDGLVKNIEKDVGCCTV